MVENNPPASAEYPRARVIPLPITLYVSGDLIFQRYERGTVLPQIFDPLGKARSRDGKRARDWQAEFPNRHAHTPRLAPAFERPTWRGLPLNRQ
jgi:hypothetical protein